MVLPTGRVLLEYVVGGVDGLLVLLADDHQEEGTRVVGIDVQPLRREDAEETCENSTY